MNRPSNEPMRQWRPRGRGALSWQTIVNAIAAVVLVASAALWVWRVSAPTFTAAPLESMAKAGTLASSVTPLGSADSLIAVAVNGNVFSATRRAPTSRFVVPGSVDAAPASPMVPSSDSLAGATTMSAEDASLPRLSGIVSIGGERRALLQLSAADGHASLYRVGDVHAGYRIVRIDADRVILSHASGTRTLRLMDRPSDGRPDSLEVSRE